MKILTPGFIALLAAALFVAVALFTPVAARIAGYAPPPSDYDALSAVQARIQEKSDESYYAGAGAPISTRANYPLDVRLFRCEENPDRLLPASNGYSKKISGYECVVNIYPAGEPAYRVGGFFFFDGLSWRYYGPLRPPEIIESDKYEQDYEPGVIRPKEGAITYRGFAGSSYIDGPYDSRHERASDRAN